MDVTPLQTTKSNVNTKFSPLNTYLDSRNFVDFLITKNYLNTDKANELKLRALKESKKMEEVVYESWDINNIDLYHRYYAEFKNWKYIDLDDVLPNKDILSKVNKDIFYDHNFIPVNLDVIPNLSTTSENINSGLSLAMKDPLDLQGVKLLESIIKIKVNNLFYTNPDKIKSTLDKEYSAIFTGELNNNFNKRVDHVTKNNNSFEESSVVNIVNMILDYAVNHKASDIHIEPKENKIVVRFRLSGVLIEKMSINNINLHPPLLARIKILSDMKIDEHRIPQDGRFDYKSSNLIVDVRVSSIPTVYGEKVVMRILERNVSIISLEELGLRYYNLEFTKNIINTTQGIVFVTGPTGSGKTKTLSTILSMINKPSVNIITLEDPVEVRIDGVNHVQVNPEVGLNFANGLRAFLRQDPDYIMVGEIRDHETATLAIQASLVGRMVYTTLHTNSAASTFTRLIDMGVEKYVLLSTIKMSIGQRLVRKLCPYCKRKANLTEIDKSFIRNVFDSINQQFKDSSFGKMYKDKLNEIDENVYEPVGCSRCEDTGYIGRIGIFECLVANKDILSLVKNNSSESEIESLAVQNGMITLLQDGILRVLDGDTSLKEVFRVRY